MSILKPLAGADDALAGNLRSFFEQQGVNVQLVFGVADPRDPAIEVVRRLQLEFPGVASTLVVHEGGRALNPKVANLLAMAEVAQHEIWVVADSNVRVGADYAASCVADLARGGLVSHRVRGARAKTLGARLESLYLDTFVADGVAVPTTILGHAAVLGKSMAFPRSTFARLGGFESVGNVLAEDYFIGQMFAAAGERVVIGSVVVENVCERTTLRGFLARCRRWATLRARLEPAAYLGEVFLHPVVAAPIAIAMGLPVAAAVTASLIASWIRDAHALGSAPSIRVAAARCVLLPLRDAIVLVAWAVAPFQRDVDWRTRRVRLGPGTRIFELSQSAPSPAGC